MSTMEKTARRPLKVRDKIKYAFATMLGLATIFAISLLIYGRMARHRVSPSERQTVQEFFSRYGNNGELPPKIKMPAGKPAVE